MNMKEYSYKNLNNLHIKFFKFIFIGLFPTNYMQTPSLSFVPIFVMNAHSNESDEKLIFRFSYFEL